MNEGKASVALPERASSRHRVAVTPFPPWRLLASRMAGVAIAVLGAVYLAWRVTALGGSTSLALSFWTAELVAYCSITWSVAVLWQRKVRSGLPSPPRGTLDIFIPVCGEPSAMVEQTLRAALAVGYPHRVWLLNDGRLAQKANWQEIEDLADTYSVRCLTRTQGRRGKAANLNGGLCRSSGEFVGVIDADHQVDVRFAHETLGYFESSNVALVTTPQAFHLPGDDVLNNREPFFYEHQQPSKDAANAAFSCGNGVVYRRSALDSIGGFSEWNLVEDLHTSYQLHAAGFETVYHPFSVTVGTAPSTAAGLAKQRLTWAVDSLRILFRDSPIRKSGLTFAQRFHYLHTTTLYLTGIAQLTFWVSPFVYLLFQASAVRGAEAGTEYAATAGPYYGAVFVWLTTFLGVRNTLRAMAQRTFLAPIFLLAAVNALFGRRVVSNVTEKIAAPRFSLLLLPMIGISTLTLAGLAYTAAAAERRMTIAVTVASATTLLMTGMLTAVTTNENARRALRFGLAGGTAVASAAFVVRAF